MRTLQIVKAYKHPKFVLLGLTVFALLLAVMAINSESISDTNYVAALGSALIVSLVLPIGGFCGCVFMTIPFTSVLKLPIEAFSFMTLMQLLLIARCIFSNHVRLDMLMKISSICVILELFPFVAYGQTITNLILLIFNFLTFYCIYKLTQANKIEIPHLLLCFSIGVFVAGTISLNYDINIYELSGYRFAGLWTDPNFWGMFCLIGIVSLLIIGFKRPLLFIIFVPLILALAYQGFLTLSRTFIVVSSLMIIVISIAYLRKSILGAIAITIILAAAVYYALPYAMDVFKERGIQHDDISNGRFTQTTTFLEYIVNDIPALCLGMGYNNISNVNSVFHITKLATHNTYADLLIDFGIINILIFGYILLCHKKYIKSMFRNINSLPGIICCVLIFYIATLSTLKYALTYLLLGMFCGFSSIKSNKKTNSKNTIRVSNAHIISIIRHST